MNPSSVQAYIRKIFGYLIRFDWLLVILFLTLSMLQIWRTRYVPSLDGPQHLYNAHVLSELIRGNDLFREFFRINPMIVGYWSGHIFLGLFKLVFPAWLAEKLFLTAYVAGMFFSFRFLIRSITRHKENLLVYLIIPFIFHNYLLLGYYSFSIAAIFFFWAFGYWIRIRERFRWKEMIGFGVLVMGIFLSHALVFLFFAISFLFLWLATHIHASVSDEHTFSWEGLLSQIWRLGISVMPALILWIIYVRSVMDINSTVAAATYSTRELVLFILRIRQLVGFSHEIETSAYITLFVTLVVLGLIALVVFIQRRQKGEGHWIEILNTHYIWVTLSLLFLTAYFFLPDRISAGSITHIFVLYFFLTLIVFLASFPMPRIIQMASLIVLIVVMILARQNHLPFMQKLNKDIADIQEMSPHMEEGSTVLSINTSDNWIHLHFQLYAADNKALVHLNNPQCAGQFPIIWNENRLPECYVGDQPYRPGGAPSVEGEGHRKLQVDYITVFYYPRLWENEAFQYWQEILEEHYELVMTTPRELGALYHRIK